MVFWILDYLAIKLASVSGWDILGSSFYILRSCISSSFHVASINILMNFTEGNILIVFSIDQKLVQERNSGTLSPALFRQDAVEH